MLQPMLPKGQCCISPIESLNFHTILLIKFKGTHIEESISTAAKIITKRIPGWSLFVMKEKIRIPFPIVPAIRTKAYKVTAMISDAVNGCLTDNGMVTGTCFKAKR